jgi:NAD(P)-dependent dehydrogenase (short-subunit alcohol dehydrogenase family)
MSFDSLCNYFEWGYGGQAFYDELIAITGAVGVLYAFVPAIGTERVLSFFLSPAGEWPNRATPLRFLYGCIDDLTVYFTMVNAAASGANVTLDWKVESLPVHDALLSTRCVVLFYIFAVLNALLVLLSVRIIFTLALTVGISLALLVVLVEGVLAAGSRFFRCIYGPPSYQHSGRVGFMFIAMTNYDLVRLDALVSTGPELISLSSNVVMGCYWLKLRLSTASTASCERVSLFFICLVFVVLTTISFWLLVMVGEDSARRNDLREGWAETESIYTLTCTFSALVLYMTTIGSYFCIQSERVRKAINRLMPYLILQALGASVVVAVAACRLNTNGPVVTNDNWWPNITQLTFWRFGGEIGSLLIGAGQVMAFRSTMLTYAPEASSSSSSSSSTTSPSSSTMPDAFFDSIDTSPNQLASLIETTPKAWRHPIAAPPAWKSVRLLRTVLTQGVFPDITIPHLLKGKHAVITGGNRGVGLETAKGLRRIGASITIMCRDVLLAEKAVHELKEVAGVGTVENVIVDLADLDSVNATCTMMKRKAGIDILIANAGVMTSSDSTTKQNFELTFGTNVLGHMLLIEALIRMRLLQAEAKVLILTGDIYVLENVCPLDGTRGGQRAYFASKLGNVWMRSAFEKKYPQFQWFAVHPGLVASDLWRHTPSLARPPPCVMISVAQAANPVVRCAAAKELKPGYYHRVFGGPIAHPKGDAGGDLERSVVFLASCMQLLESWLRENEGHPDAAASVHD